MSLWTTTRLEKLCLCLISATVKPFGKLMLAHRLVPVETGTKFGALPSISVRLGGTYSFPFLPRKAKEPGMSVTI